MGHIISALKDEGILTPRTLAYALATVQHETAGTFKPIEEYGGREQAKKLGYEGGENYFGRGFIQLTHKGNYADMGQKIGIADLAENPEKALNPEISAKILAKFMNERGVSKLADAGDFAGARRPINPDNLGGQIANIAQGYLGAIGPDLGALTKKPAEMGTIMPSAISRAAAPQRQVSPGLPPLISQLAKGAKPEAKVPTEFRGFGGPITQSFGNVNQELYADVPGNVNRGTDVGMNPNTPIQAPKDLEIVEAKTGGYNTGFGNYVLARDPNTGETFRFSHLNKVDVKVGDRIPAGTQLGVSGQSGRSTGPHLDVEYTNPQGQLMDVSKAYPQWFTAKARQAMTEGIQRPMQFQQMPQVQMPEAMRLPSQARVQGASTVRPPAFNVRLTPQAAPTTAPRFTSGFTPQTAKVTRSFADIVREGLGGPQTPQEQERTPQAQRQVPQQTAVQRAMRDTQQAFGIRRQQQQARAGTPSAPGAPRGAGAGPSMRTTSPIVHTVKWGETPSGIAQRYGISDWRKVWGGDPRRMPAGATLRIGGGNSARRQTRWPTPSSCI